MPSFPRLVIPAYEAEEVEVATGGTEIEPESRALWVGTGGNLVVDFSAGESNVTLSGIQDGTLLPIAVTRVYDTTTADGLVVLR